MSLKLFCSLFVNKPQNKSEVRRPNFKFIFLYVLCFLHFFIFLYFCTFVLLYFCTFVLLYFLYFCTFSFGWTVHMNFHAKSGVCSSKNDWVMSTFVLMYFFVLLYFFNLFGISIWTFIQNLEFVAQKKKRIMLNLGFGPIPCLAVSDQLIYRAARFLPANTSDDSKDSPSLFGGRVQGRSWGQNCGRILMDDWTFYYRKYQSDRFKNH